MQLGRCLRALGASVWLTSALGCAFGRGDFVLLNPGTSYPPRSSTAPVVLTVNNAGGSTFAGSLGIAGQDNFRLVKNGAGALTLTGTSTFTGATTSGSPTRSSTWNAAASATHRSQLA